ncbi:probable receptor-like protein kinase At2g23200 isoform X2 [Rutidosis leptorrhynchoides]
MEFLRVPYETVASAFNNFADENLIAQGTSAMVYKGQLIKSGDLINVVARKYSNMVGFGASEMVASYFLNHKYINASVLNYIEPDENNDSVIIVTKHEANGSLDKHLTGSTLTWMQRLKICVGVADALNYIHYGLAFDEHGCVIHSNLYPSKILLDDNWEPKLSGFGHCKKLIDWHHLHLTKDYNCNKLQYMDPAYEQTNGITVKSDVFSFGVVLFEVLFGMEASIKDDDQWYFARLARLHYEEKTLDGMIDPDLQKQMDLQSLKIFSEIAYFCLREERKQRPDSKHVLKTLHTALELQQKYEHSTAGLELSTSDLLKEKKLRSLTNSINRY